MESGITQFVPDCPFHEKYFRPGYFLGAPKRFAEFSGRPAEINREVGGAFSLFGGHIVGRTVELVPNQRIVQAWRVVTWPEGVYSIVKFELKAQGSGTHLVFDHTGFPEGLHDHLAEGWESNYWALLKKYLH